MPDAAAAASLNPAARGERLRQPGDAALADRPDGDAQAQEARRLRLESVLRAIDASVPEDARDPALTETRKRLVGEVGPA